MNQLMLFIMMRITKWQLLIDVQIKKEILLPTCMYFDLLNSVQWSNTTAHPT